MSFKEDASQIKVTRPAPIPNTTTTRPLTASIVHFSILRKIQGIEYARKHVSIPAFNAGVTGEDLGLYLRQLFHFERSCYTHHLEPILRVFAMQQPTVLLATYITTTTIITVGLVSIMLAWVQH
jgi:hypothetical protein